MGKVFIHLPTIFCELLFSLLAITSPVVKLYEGTLLAIPYWEGISVC